ncbi:MAG: OmpH family outer membrane protein [Elusimicrobia bacterium]|nr:OmpH family outer membrane protein [Elusimicrobiota bacterium]
MGRFKLAVFVWTIFSFSPVQKLAALEISLEENKAERGSVGYVDIQRVFKAYPETLRAREDFEQEIRRREEGMNQKKAEILVLKAEISKLKQDRELASKLPVKEEVQASTPSVQGSTQATINLPGVSNVPVSSVLPAGAAGLQELDDRISQKTQEIQNKQQELRSYQKQVERELLDLENRKSQIILGRICQAVSTLAQSEGISVVVDKKSILYGQGSVDLTDKLLNKLQGGL